ncbi:MAG TPA: flagellar hook-length control protein FliK [Hyphomicrobiaceae bacterium]|nr:flagellar hook-length control protein FliK [Hyphomicrobiaceae bacterium]
MDKEGEKPGADACLTGPTVLDTADTDNATCREKTEPARLRELQQTLESGDRTGCVTDSSHLQMREDRAVAGVLGILDGDLSRNAGGAGLAGEPAAQIRRSQIAGASTPVTAHFPNSGIIPALSRAEFGGYRPAAPSVVLQLIGQETHFKPAITSAELGNRQSEPQGDWLQPVKGSTAGRLNRVKPPDGDVESALGTARRMAELVDPLVRPPEHADDRGLGTILQQIGEGVQRAVGPPSGAAMQRPAEMAEQQVSSFSTVLRSIKLELNPHALGTVTVVMTARDGELRLHLEVASAETFTKVEQARDALSGRLIEAGYAVTNLTVGRTAGADPMPHSGAQGESGGQDGVQSGAKQGDTAGSGARNGASQFAMAKEEPAQNARSPAANGRIEGPMIDGSHFGRFRPV